MTVIDPGHRFLVRQLDSNSQQLMRFVKREGIGYPGNIGHYPGTNIQEVLRVLISRTQYLQKQIPCWQNDICTFLYRLALNLLEHRAAKRHNRPFAWNLKTIELQPINPLDGHIKEIM